MIQAIGFAAAMLTSLAFFPQVVKTWRLKEARDLSMLTLVCQTLGVALWVVYGVSIASVPVIASNTLTMILMLILIGFKLSYGEGPT
jgi:MtN3 and saliva related transmembrane protein